MFIKEIYTAFNKCVDKALNFKEVYFVDTSLSVNYNNNKTLQHCAAASFV